MEFICEKFTWRRGLEHVGASWLRRARLGCRGNLKSRVFFTLGRFFLTLRDQTSHILCQFMCVCMYMCACKIPAYSLWWVCHLIFQDLHSFIMWVRLLHEHLSIPFSTHTRDKKQTSRQTKYYYKPQYEGELITVVRQVQQKLLGRQAGAV